MGEQELFDELEQLNGYTEFTEQDNHNQKTNTLKCMYENQPNLFKDCPNSCLSKEFCPNAYRISEQIFGNPRTLRSLDIIASDNFEMQEPVSLKQLIKLKQKIIIKK
jgi:hypothetical protein